MSNDGIKMPRNPLKTRENTEKFVIFIQKKQKILYIFAKILKKRKKSLKFVYEYGRISS